MGKKKYRTSGYAMTAPIIPPRASVAVLRNPLRELSESDICRAPPWGRRPRRAQVTTPRRDLAVDRAVELLIVQT